MPNANFGMELSHNNYGKGNSYVGKSIPGEWVELSLPKNPGDILRVRPLCMHVHHVYS